MLFSVGIAICFSLKWRIFVILICIHSRYLCVAIEYECKYRYYIYINKLFIDIFSMEVERKIDRFLQYLYYKGITENKATVDCNLSVGLIGQAKRGKSDLGDKAIEKILIKYQDINRIWLLTGDGEMLNTPASAIETSDAPPAMPHHGMIAIPESVWNVIEQQANSLTARDKQIDVLLRTHERQIDEHNLHITELISIIKEQVKKTDAQTAGHADSAVAG